MKCKRSSDARELDQSGMHTVRMQALKAIERGQAVAKVAKTFGVAERTLYRWLSRFASDGQQGLKNQPKTGRAPKLNGEEVAWLARTLREETPPGCQRRCVCRSNAVSVGKKLTGQHEKLPK